MRLTSHTARLAGAAWVLVVVLGACDGVPHVDLDGGAVHEPVDGARDDGGERGSVELVPPVIESTSAAAGGAGSWTSPPECPTPGESTFCADCYGWTDFGADSLGRNATGDDFGSVATGDFNGDGYPDLAVGAPGDDGGGGIVYIYLGTERGFEPWQRLHTPAGEGFGYRTAAVDVNGDGYDDLIATYLEKGGGVAYYAGAKGGLGLKEVWAARDQVGPDGNYLDDQARMGESLVAADFDGDGTGDFAVGAPGYLDSSATVTGTVWLMFGTSHDAWLWLPSLGYSITGDDEFGAALAGASDSFDLAISSPGYDGQDGVVVGVEVASSSSISATADWSVRADAVLAGPIGYALWHSSWGKPSLPTWPFDPRWYAIENSGNDGLYRPIAVFDADADGKFEMFGVDPTSTVPPFHFFFDLYDDADAAVYAEPDELPSQTLDYATLGFSSATRDWNGDGYDDVGIGAPGSGSGGLVFGYFGGPEERTTDDNGVDFEDAGRLFELDQELPACDRCVAMSLADGSYCPDGICLDQICSPRFGCGDGWREPGPTPTREGCDDRNTAGGDTCSATCEPVAFLVAGEPMGLAAPASHHAVAVDGTGAMLVVWTEQLAASTEVRARRYNRYGVPVDALESFLTIATLPGPGLEAEPVVAGRPNGWTVAWVQPAGGEVGTIGVRTVSLGSTPLGAARGVLAGETTVRTRASHPGVATIATGQTFVAWTDATDPTSPRVRYRWLAADLSPATEVLELDGASGLDPVVALSGSTVLAAWTEQPTIDDPVRVLARRLTFAGPVDVAAIEVASGAGSPAVTSRTGGFAIAWVSRASDTQGDISARTADTSGALGAAVSVSAAGGYPDVRPSIAGVGSGWVVAWEEPRELLVRLAAGGGASLPAEATTLMGQLDLDRLTRDVSLTTTPRGVWVVWSGTRSTGDPTASRSTWGYLLPPT